MPSASRSVALLSLALLTSASMAGDPDTASGDLQVFLEETEAGLLEHMVRRERAMWVHNTHITHDTEILVAQAAADMMAFVSEAAQESTRFEGEALTPEQTRKLAHLRLALDLPAPSDREQRGELASLASQMESMYGKGRPCLEDGRCMSLGELSDVIRESRDWDELLEAWLAWREVSVPMKDRYARFVELANEGARELGFQDVGHLWRSRYTMDMAEPDLEAELDRLWGQVEPLYRDLHCAARRSLQERYGKKRVPSRSPIPAHLLGNMWAQEWSALDGDLAPLPESRVDLDAAIQASGWDEEAMVRKAESFFISMGFDPLPETFWERSMFVKPTDREAVCHASAWDVDFDMDLRIKMCIQPRFDDLATLHHELGHVYYYASMRHHDPLLRDDANAAFNEAIGDTIQLSVTPEYLVTLGLLEEAPPDDLNTLMQGALGAVAFMPFGLLVDRWRWDVFSGAVSPDEYNQHWWALREKYQGVSAPVPRGEEHFDPGAKYHVPANVPYVRYFLSTILQYQFHRALCRQGGHEGPLHTCSNYQDEEAGRRLREMMELGASRPWPEALEVLTGETELDATAILEYYAPLHDWLKKSNKRDRCGW